jgi:hypothetical protein
MHNVKMSTALIIYHHHDLAQLETEKDYLYQLHEHPLDGVKSLIDICFERKVFD